MVISDGVDADASHFNSAFISKSANDTKTGTLTLNSGVGASVIVQADINQLKTDVAAITAGGGGGVAVLWQEGANAPVGDSYSTLPKVYAFEFGLAQELTALVKIPDTYIAGNPFGMIANIFSPGVDDEIQLLVEATLTNPSDTIGDETNQATSTNAVIGMAGGALAGLLQTVDFAITTDGTINSVAIAPGALITLRLYRATDLDTAIVYYIPGTEEIYIT